jgi:pyridoxal phosphate enzyme (YggS family)
MSIRDNIVHLKNTVPDHVKIVAVSKTKPKEAILEAYNTGHRIFGENKAQELIDKQPQLPEDINWHFIGHLQTNKVKYLAPFIQCIESVDSLKLLREINKQAMKNKSVIQCLLQFHIAKETSKFGLDYEEAIQILQSDEYKEMNNIKIIGVMGMATFTDNNVLIREEFKSLKEIFEKLRNEFFSDKESFNEISMGMSGDYQIAIEEGSTMVRIGSAIFGER